MLATLLSVALFTYLSVVGYAVLALLSDDEPLYRLLLAPAVGATTLMLPTFLLNEIGVPVQSFAIGLVPLIFVAALIVLWRKGRRISLQEFWPYAMLILFGLLVIGWPMLRFGFDWVSYCNDDMANYCMGAQRVLHYGYFQPPDAQALAGRDYSQFLWFLHLLHRPGSEMVLATVMALTRLSPLQIFMPTIMAFTLCQISAAGAMAYSAVRSRPAVWMTMLLVGLSSLVALGTMYQLIAQVIGLAMVCALIAVLMRPIDELAKLPRVRSGILIGLLTVGAVIFYAELIPFVILGYVVFTVVNLRSWKVHREGGLAALGIAVVIVVVVLNRFLAFAIVYVLGQSGRVAPEDPLTTRFPDYMMPAGPAYFWGILPTGQQFPTDFWLSLLIGIALIVSMGVAVIVARGAVRKWGSAIISVVMGAVFIFLFQKPSGFGMFKLAMYLQPFILTAIVIGWISLWRRPLVQILPLVALGVIGLRAQFTYVRTSQGTTHGAFGEIPAASSTHLVREYAGLLAEHPGAAFEMDSYNPVLAKYQMLESRGHVATFPSNDFLVNLVATDAPAALTGQRIARIIRTIIRDYFARFPSRVFDLHPDAVGTPHYNPFRLNQIGRESMDGNQPWLMICQTGRQTPFNRWHDPEDSPGNFRCGPPEDFRNHLIFISSRFGEPYEFGGQNVGVFSLEADAMLPDRTMAGIGRYLLFRVNQPTKKIRIEMSLSDSFAGNRINLLPPAEVIGTSRTRLPFEGRGSARVFSDPITPQLVDGQSYIGLDMGAAGTYFNYRPWGLMRLWGVTVRLDARKIVGFLRDLSLVSDEEYQALKPPTSIQKFPRDLTDRNLEYSGIYEDGWVGDQSWVVLSQPNGAARVVCQLFSPLTNDSRFTTEVTLRVDGQVAARKTMALGETQVSADLSPGPVRRKIGLSFSKLQNLPDPDGRPIGAELMSIRIEPGTTTVVR